MHISLHLPAATLATREVLQHFRHRFSQKSDAVKGFVDLHLWQFLSVPSWRGKGQIVA